ncbi:MULTISPECIES: glycosyltransferase family 2 protein [Spirulina sp. CCY15215]|uniref:glycosyltransferase family 2 protein n=1 Tax=Spirulina sp. CCY15215 TaxID=2767591 RepID=UPI001950309C|nr:glycosyltransferase family 2 protein [Spirulina major]
MTQHSTSESEKKIPVSVLIPAKNEELNMPKCLECVSRADEIFVVDSHSSDRTIEICKEQSEIYNIKIVQFDYERGSWPKKKNWALENLKFKHEWVLIVDCDEQITDELWREIENILKNPQYDGYYINRKVYFFDRWIKYGGKYPDWNLRLFKHAKGRYENLLTEDGSDTGDNEVHEHVILDKDSQEGFIENAPMIHMDFKSISAWLARHNRYSNWEARFYDNLREGVYEKSVASHQGRIIQPKLFQGTPLEKKRFIRKVWVWLPLRPLLRFIIVYFLKLGFLDGRAGYFYARLISHYEAQIGIKWYEMRNCQNNSQKMKVTELEKTQTKQLETNEAN